MKELKLELTTERVLAFEENTGKDMLTVLKEMDKTKSFSMKDLIELFKACGEGYGPKTFDEWEVSFQEKVVAIVSAIKVYFGGTSKNS